MSSEILWTKKKYYVKDLNREVDLTEIDFFSIQNKYKIIWLDKLGEGEYGIVDRYQLEIYNLKYSLLKKVIIAGKRFNNKISSDMIYTQEYILKAFAFKSFFPQEKKYTLRIFNSLSLIEEILNVDNNEKIHISNILFFCDFTNLKNVVNVLSLNNKSHFNKNILTCELDLEQIFFKMIQDLYFLWKNGFKVIALDIWLLIIFEDSNFDLKIIDFDHIKILDKNDDIFRIKNYYSTLFTSFLNWKLEWYSRFCYNLIEEIFK